MRMLVTGGAGFIGSHFVRQVLAREPTSAVVVLDKLTYAGNLANLAPVVGDPRYRFLEGDICDAAVVDAAMDGCDAVVNFAAETHVDRSILDPGAFVRTDVTGIWVLLEAARRHEVARFVQVSTDEVYGHVAVGSSREEDPLKPRSPYAASKASAELFAHAYSVTYGLATVITRGSNTLGPNQYPEKAIPLFVTNALDDQPLPIYGDGKQVRDWLYVEDHCEAIRLVLDRGQPGEAYNVGAGNECENLDVALKILSLLGKPDDLMHHVPDRPGHDRRYSLDTTKLGRLGWRARHDFESALCKTVEWYAANEEWWRPIKSGEYLEYYRRNYADRERLLSPRS